MLPLEVVEIQWMLLYVGEDEEFPQSMSPNVCISNKVK